MKLTTTIERDHTLNGDPMGENLHHQNHQDWRTNEEETESGPVSQLANAEQRFRRLYTVVRNFAALASHENEPPPTVYLIDALELLEEQLRLGLEDLQDGIEDLGQSEGGQ